MVLSNIKTPGVYVEEIALFPPSVAQVPTAIPGFIGHTEFAKDSDGNSLGGKPTKIKSLLEFITLFGKDYRPDEFKIILKKNSEEIKSISPDRQFYLYNALRQFYDNGGGECYIVSVGSFSDTLSRAEFAKGIDELKKFDAPTLIAFPDAVAMLDASNKPDYSEIAELQKQSLAHCATMQDRFSILDLAGGDKPTDTNHTPVEAFRNNVGVNALSYGAAYYPWVVTNYEFELHFGQMKLEIDNSPGNTTVTMDKLKTDFSKDTAEKDLLKDYTNKEAVVTAFVQKLYTNAAKQKDFTKNGIEFLKKELQAFETAVLESDGTTHKDQLKAYFDQLAILVNTFPKIVTDLAGDAEKLSLVNAFKSNLVFIKTVKLLIAIEKDPETLDNTGRTSNDLKNTVYKDLLTDWTGGVAFDDLKLDELDPAIDPSTYLDTKAGTLVILNDVKKKITTSILNAYDSLFYQLKLSEQQMLTRHSFLKGITDKLKEKLRTIPPSGTIAGIYTQVDNTRGVWKAPANVSVTSIIGPAVKIDNKEQEELNVDTTGKSINAIRSFTGKGTLVWGARTLAGNDNEWRYVPVRRFFIMVEESVKKATEPFVFENNDANTWMKVKVMIENFLTLQWRAGALQGAKTEDAFFVHVGLNETMTQDDILNGRMIVEIGMAVVRPAEFIILRFSHKMMEQ
jgi:phage tail sheath protein FI